MLVLWLCSSLAYFFACSKKWWTIEENRFYIASLMLFIHTRCVARLRRATSSRCTGSLGTRYIHDCLLKKLGNSAIFDYFWEITIWNSSISKIVRYYIHLHPNTFQMSYCSLIYYVNWPIVHFFWPYQNYYTDLLSLFFSKNFVKPTILLTKLLNS